MRRCPLTPPFPQAIFDFDQTILAIHAFGQHIEPEAVASRSMEADFTDLAFFTALVHLLREKGVSVAIASFGRYEVIQAYMDRAFGIVAGDAASEATRIFTRASISTPTSVGGHDGFVLPGGKNPQLQALAAVYGLAPVNIFFFDGACCMLPLGRSPPSPPPSPRRRPHECGPRTDGRLHILGALPGGV